MRFPLVLMVAITLAATAAEARSLEIETVRHALRGKAAGLVFDTRGIVLSLEGGPAYRVSLQGARIHFRPLPAAALRPPVADALADGTFAMGSRNIRRAWLAAPTSRYDHGVLGDSIEAGAIVAELADGTVVRHELADDAVFEDRRPRLVDLDGDGYDEILLVKSYLSTGAALALFQPRGRELVLVAEADAIGRAHRWLNPVGAADFDGDGRPEAAAVITPHIGGTLAVYEWKGSKFVLDHARYGFSNHAMGSRELGLAAVIDLDGDGIQDMVVPDAGRRTLVGLTFAGGGYRELFRLPLTAPFASGIVVADADGDGIPEILFADADDTLWILRIRR